MTVSSLVGWGGTVPASMSIGRGHTRKGSGGSKDFWKFLRAD
jgi:hypothetical protein